MLAFFHTAPANADNFEAIAQELSPGLATRHVIRAELLEEAAAAGGVSEDLQSRIVAAIESSIEPGDQVMLCTCSTIGGGADLARHPTVSVLRVDRPMAQAAVAAGKRILLAACLESTVEPTRQLLLGEGTGLEIEALLIPEAWPHWVAGSKNEYWSAIAKRIAERIGEFDSVVLAQASMAGAAQLLSHCDVPVLSSPRSGVAEAIGRLNVKPRSDTNAPELPSAIGD